MSLTVGTGPFGHFPGGEFNTELDRDGLLYLEASPRRIRGVVEGETIVDSRHARLLHEHGRLPIHYFPRDEVRTELLEPGAEGETSTNKGPQRRWSLRVGDRTIDDAAHDFPDPPEPASALKGLLAFRWAVMDEWYEEDELAVVHARDPYHRVDVLDTTRHVKVSLDGEPLADSRRARVLFETGLPPRWYVPYDDVRTELLEQSDKRTGCAYKGFASYWSVKLGDRLEEDLVWTYREPRHDAVRVKDYLAFFNERTDIEIDGEPQERPLTQWSPDWKYRLPGESG